MLTEQFITYSITLHIETFFCKLLELVRIRFHMNIDILLKLVFFKVEGAF